MGIQHLDVFAVPIIPQGADTVVLYGGKAEFQISPVVQLVQNSAEVAALP